MSNNTAYTYSDSESEVTRFVESNLIGTKINVPGNNGISPQTGGYLYKNVSWSEKNKKKTYLGIVTKGTTVSFGVNAGGGFIRIGIAKSTSRKYREYRVTSQFKSTWKVYDKYSGYYVRTETFNQKVKYKSYSRVK
ncbi:LMxysn_1693 family intestinal colonization protein [Virgibacillus dakarensis]|uniref:LMxysn_1693 family intestinal colonization protein n=1 Tax=Virgibacillus dakarensis TaxID=1917889 RepID=UPI00389B3445